MRPAAQQGGGRETLYPYTRWWGRELNSQKDRGSLNKLLEGLVKVDGEGLEDPGRKTGPSPLQEKNQQELEMAVKQGETRERIASFPNSDHFGETLWTPSTKKHLESAGLVESFPDWLSPPLLQLSGGTWTTMWPGSTWWQSIMGL